MTNPYVLLWLEGPLQSWGFDSKFGRRDTLRFPTKSALLGMACCASGATGKIEERMLAAFAKLDLQIAAYARKDKDGQPCPAEPLLRDFHMVGSGYNTKDPWQNLLVPKKSDGTKPTNSPGTKITYRYYIQDMAFAAALQVPEALLGLLISSFQNPVWDLYLGRKSCVPTEFIYQGYFETVEEAIDRAETLAAAKNRTRSFHVLQGEHEGDDVFSLNDVPIRFRPQKQYRDRVVTVINTGN